MFSANLTVDLLEPNDKVVTIATTVDEPFVTKRSPTLPPSEYTFYLLLNDYSLGSPAY